MVWQYNVGLVSKLVQLAINWYSWLIRVCGLWWFKKNKIDFLFYLFRHHSPWAPIVHSGLHPRSPLTFHRETNTTTWQQAKSLFLKRDDAPECGNPQIPAKKQPTYAESCNHCVQYEKKGARWPAFTDAVIMHIAKDMVPIHTVEKLEVRNEACLKPHVVDRLDFLVKNV